MYLDSETAKPNGTETESCPDGSGVLPTCASLAVPYVPFQREGSKRYEQTEALNNGTLFPGLNLPFHLKKEAASIANDPLSELQALEFVILELALYLDTHQTDTEAFTLFRQYVALEKAGREKYESHYGPLLLNSTSGQKDFSAWIKNPWPWDISEGGKN